MGKIEGKIHHSIQPDWDSGEICKSVGNKFFCLVVEHNL